MKNIKVTKALIKKLKPYWESLKAMDDLYRTAVYGLEKKITKKIGIKGIEFFMGDNEYVGIGNVDRTMRLIFGQELEK